MSKLALGLFLAVISIGANGKVSPKMESENLKISFVTPEEAKELLKKHPNHVELTRKVHNQEIQDTKRPKFTVEYILGERTHYDWIVAQDSQSLTWAEPREVQIKLNYPSQGVGSIVTYVNILVNQSNAVGRAYVIEGGIGYRYIGIIIETTNTYYFDHDAVIYGQN